jgi:hypothetical protein
VTRREGDHCIDIDEFTVREKRGEEERRGVPRSHRVAVYLCWHQGGAGRGVDARFVPCTVAGHEVGEGDDRWGLGVGEREGEKGGRG